MRHLCVTALIWVAGASIGAAQQPSDLQIRLGLYWVGIDGGEKFAGMSYSNHVEIGTPRTATFSAGAKCDAWTLSSRAASEDAVTAWRIETTPLRVVRSAVTFRLRWVHVPNPQQQLSQLSFDKPDSRLPGDDLELTLRPGESWEVDRIPLPRGVDVQGKPCPMSASIRAIVDVYPDADEERRLVAADMWLVERLPNGTEVQRSQPLTVRALPFRPFRFYFDRLTDGAATLDIYGILNATLDANGLAVGVETRSRWTPEKRNISGPQKFLNSDLHLKPDETVEIRLPAFGDEAGVFAKRALSIRIRARQLR